MILDDFFSTYTRYICGGFVDVIDLFVVIIKKNIFAPGVDLI